MTSLFVIALIVTIGIANFARERFAAALKRGGATRAPGGLSAAEIAREFLDTSGAPEVQIVEHDALVTDYYDPARRTLFLHPHTSRGRSAAAWALALHEAAHAAQAPTMAASLDLRNSNIKLTRYVPALSALALIGLGLLRRPPLTIGWRLIALIWFGVMALNLFSLPVEFNASRRALAFLERRFQNQPETLELFQSLLSGVAWRDTAAFLRSPVYCLFGALPVGGSLRPR